MTQLLVRLEGSCGDANPVVADHAGLINPPTAASLTVTEGVFDFGTLTAGAPSGSYTLCWAPAGGELNAYILVIDPSATKLVKNNSSSPKMTT